jgi:thiamine biosynthesis lipoprotein
MPENSTNSTFSFAAMGTLMSFRAAGEGAASEATCNLLNEAAEIVKSLDELLSLKNPASELSRLNAAANTTKLNEWTTLSHDTAAALKEAMEYQKKTGGAFDPTLGSLADGEIKWNERGQVRLPAGANIDFAGFAKGYAADRLREFFRGKIRSGIFSLGTSTILAIGKSPDGGAWKVGLREPEKKTLSSFGVLCLADKSLSTSGNYESAVTIDPRAGRPAGSGLRSVTVVSESGAMSEAYSTALLVMGLERSLRFYERERDFEAVFVTEKKQVLCTDNARDIFESRQKGNL